MPSKYYRFTRVAGSCMLAGLLASACGTASVPSPTNRTAVAHAKAPSRDRATNAISAGEEQRVQALAQFALGIVNELNNDSQGALDAYYKSAVADPSHEDLIIELVPRLLQAKKTDLAIELLKRATAAKNASGAMFGWLGVAQAQAGFRDQAIRSCHRSIKLDPALSLPYQTLAEIYWLQGKSNATIRILRHAFAVPDSKPEFLVEVAETASGFKELINRTNDSLKPLVVAALDRALAMNSDSPLTKQKIGDGYRAIGEYQKAAELYRQLMARFSSVPGLEDVLRERLIDVYLKAGDRKAAIKLLDDILKDAPTNAQAYLAAGALLVEAKDYNSAIDYFDKALLLNPAFEPVYYELAGLQITLNQPQKALELLNTARSKFAQSFTLELYSALAYSHLKDYVESLKHFTAAEVIANATDPKKLNHAFYFQLAATLERQGDIEQAEKNLRKCLEISPEDADAMNYLGYMWTEKGVRLEEARSLIEKALKLEPDNAAFLDSMGWVLFKLNQPKAALNYLLKASQSSEKPDATIQDHLGDVHAALRQWDKAIGAWKKSIAIEPSDPIQKKVESAPVKR